MRNLEVAERMRRAEQRVDELLAALAAMTQRASKAEEMSTLLQERCELLGRALDAMWDLVGEEDQQAIMVQMDAPGAPSPATTFMQMLEQRGATEVQP